MPGYATSSLEAVASVQKFLTGAYPVDGWVLDQNGSGLPLSVHSYLACVGKFNVFQDYLYRDLN
mgnify:CR=1 FL=1|jgi:hypothetical protein